MKPVEIPLGLPGPQGLVVVNQFADPADPRNQGGPEGLPGAYRVVYVLRRPYTPLRDEYAIGPESDVRGNSHLSIAKPALSARPDDGRHIKIAITDETGKEMVVLGTANDRGFLGKLETTWSADSFADARAKTFEPMMSSLSKFSTQLDIPMFVEQIDVFELRTGNWSTEFTSAPLEAPITASSTPAASSEFRGYISLYREAVNSNSERYRYLCFFKIMEALLERRNRQAQEALAARTDVARRRPEIVPLAEADRHAWLDALFPVRPNWSDYDLSSVFIPEAVGRKFNYIIDTWLRPLRVQVAHALFDAGELNLSVDRNSDYAAVHKWLPLMKCIVRRMLKDDFPEAFLPHVPDPTAKKQE